MTPDAQPPETNREERPLFGTLLASKPAGARSPGALAVAVVVHVVLIGLLILVSRPFIPTLAHKIFQPISIVIPDETVTPITFEREPQGAAVPAERRREREAAGRTGDTELTFTPGPITAIPDATPGPETPEPSESGVVGGGAPRTLSDRLRPQSLDPRLNPGTSYVPRDASPAQGVRDRIAQSLREYNDSVDAETEARRRALDWTIKTKDGKQWGIGPDGKIHLGDITLPAVAFSPPPGRRDEINNRIRDFNEIERQANQEIGRQSFKERVKAIRARKDREREEKKKDQTADTSN